MSSFGILDEDHKVVPLTLAQVAAGEFDEFHAQVDRRRVGRDIVNGLLVSTVFLCIDHGFGGTPKWFETMIFRGENLDNSVDDWQWRYETWDEAVEGHKAVVELVRIGELAKTILTHEHPGND
jgi:hypothetical protein